GSNLTNAQVLGTFANAEVDTIAAVAPGAPVYIVGDMLSTYQNGRLHYEDQYGGSPDSTAPALNQLRSQTRIRNWWYEPTAFGQMSASSLLFDRLGYATDQETWFDTVNVYQAAAVARGLLHSVGLVATTWNDTTSAGAPDVPDARAKQW